MENSKKNWLDLLGKSVAEEITEPSRSEAYGGAALATLSLGSVWILGGPIGMAFLLLAGSAIVAKLAGPVEAIEAEQRKADIAERILSLPLFLATTYGSALHHLAKDTMSVLNLLAGNPPENDAPQESAPVDRSLGPSSFERLSASVSFNASAPEREIFAADVAPETLKRDAPGRRM